MKKLKIYQNHFERYSDHEKSKETCKKQMVSIRDKAKTLHEVKQYPSSELLFFEDCANEIIKCRQVLKWTYPVSYYALESWSDAEITLFKDQVEELEKACSRTHELLERDLGPFLDISAVDRGPFYHYKSDLVNKMEILRNSYRSFVQAVSEKEFQYAQKDS